MIDVLGGDGRKVFPSKLSPALPGPEILRFDLGFPLLDFARMTAPRAIGVQHLVYV